MELSDDSQSGLDSNSQGVAALIESMSSEMSSGIETVLSDLNLMSEDIMVHRSWVQDMIATGKYHFVIFPECHCTASFRTNINQLYSSTIIDDSP